MSGGIAYVFDADASFHRHVNPEMVSLEHLDESDLEWVRDRLARHVAETDSAVGIRTLARWAQDRERFVKVMPQDYQRVLAAAEDARARGVDEIDAIMAAAHG